MSGGAAVVGRQVLHVHMSHEGQARTLMARLENLSAGPFIRAIERALTDGQAPGERLVLDALDVDLGAVREDQLHLLPERLRLALSDELARRLRGNAGGAGADVGSDGARAAADDDDLSPNSTARRVAAYLETGLWSGPIAASESGAPASDPLDEALGSGGTAPSGADASRAADVPPHLDVSDRLLALRPLGSRALERLARQISPAALERLLRRASPALSAALREALTRDAADAPGGDASGASQRLALTVRYALLQTVLGAFSEQPPPDALETLAAAAGGADARLLRAAALRLRTSRADGREVHGDGERAASAQRRDDAAQRSAAVPTGSLDLGPTPRLRHTQLSADDVRDALKTADGSSPFRCGDVAGRSLISRSSDRASTSLIAETPSGAPDRASDGSAQGEASEAGRISVTPPSIAEREPSLPDPGASLTIRNPNGASASRNSQPTLEDGRSKLNPRIARPEAGAAFEEELQGTPDGPSSFNRGELRLDAHLYISPHPGVYSPTSPAMAVDIGEESNLAAAYEPSPEGLKSDVGKELAPSSQHADAVESGARKRRPRSPTMRETPAYDAIRPSPAGAIADPDETPRPRWADDDMLPNEHPAAADRSWAAAPRPAASAEATSITPPSAAGSSLPTVRPELGQPEQDGPSSGVGYTDETAASPARNPAPVRLASTILAGGHPAAMNGEAVGTPCDPATSTSTEAGVRPAGTAPSSSSRAAGFSPETHPDAASPPGDEDSGAEPSRISQQDRGGRPQPGRSPRPDDDAEPLRQQSSRPPPVGPVRSGREAPGSDARGSDASPPRRRRREAGRHGLAALPVANSSTFDRVRTDPHAVAPPWRESFDGRLSAGGGAPRGLEAVDAPVPDPPEAPAIDRYPAWRSLFFRAERRAEIEGRPAALNILLRVAPRGLLRGLAAEAWGADRHAVAAADALGRTSGLEQGQHLARSVLVAHAAAALRAASTTPPPLRVMLSAAAAKLLSASPPHLRGDGPGLLRRAAAVARLRGDPLAADILEEVIGPAAPPPSDGVRPSRATDVVHHIDNAGLVLLAAYLPDLFQRLGLVEHDRGGRHRFKDGDAQGRAVHVLQHLARGRCDDPEPHLVLNKVLAGLPLETPLSRGVVLEPGEEAVCRGLLEAAAANWPAIGAASVEGLREAFLQREGRLVHAADGWRLTVARRTLDVLVDRLPWSFTLTFHGWMREPLHVSW